MPKILNGSDSVRLVRILNQYDMFRWHHWLRHQLSTLQVVEAGKRTIGRNGLRPGKQSLIRRMKVVPRRLRAAALQGN